MTTPVKIEIIQGTTQRVPLIRRYVDYAIVGDDCSGWKNACTGAPVPPGDFHDEDYTGCSAALQIRSDIDSPDVLWEMSTVNGRIELVGKTLTLIFAHDESAAFAFEDAMGQVEVTRPNGDVERQYELTFTVRKESTK